MTTAQIKKTAVFPPLAGALLLRCLGGCAGSLAQRQDFNPTDAELCRDLAVLPQDVNAYAGAGGYPLPADQLSPDAPLLAAETQKQTRERAAARFYAPWSQTRAAHKLEEAMWGLFSLKPERGYAENLRPYPPERWNKLHENCNTATYPNSAMRAITLRRADLRLLPTHSPYFLSRARPGQGYPFDFCQNSSLPPGAPVFISHLSRDGRWALVESASAGGWVDLADLAQVDAKFIESWMSAPLAAILNDDTILLPDSAANGGKMPPLARSADIGALLPMIQNPVNGKISILLPERAPNGFTRAAPYKLGQGNAEAWPLPLNRRRLAEQGNRMLGQPYGWGGYNGNRDCSAMMRDLFLPFGLWLPRNSASQASIGQKTDLAALEPADKEKIILGNAKPFITLIGMPGHIGLYLGEHQGRAVMLHNIWGLRTLRPATLFNEAQEGRAVIGKAVITTLSPGRERDDIASPHSLLDRIKSFNVLAEPR